MINITDKIMSIFQKHESKGEALEDDLRELFGLPREELLDELVSSILDKRDAEQEQPRVATQMYPTMDLESDRYARKSPNRSERLPLQVNVRNLATC